MYDIIRSYQGRIEVGRNQLKAHLQKVFEERQHNSDQYFQWFGESPSCNDSVSVETAIEIGLQKFQTYELARFKSIEAPSDAQCPNNIL